MAKKAAHANHTSNTVTSRARRGTIYSDAAIAKVAKAKFRRMDFDLSEGLSNEDLGKFMVPVRLAVVIMGRSKADLSKTVLSLDDGDLLKEGGAAQGLIINLSAARDKFEGLARICDAGISRLLIAAHAAAVLDGNSRAERR